MKAHAEIYYLPPDKPMREAKHAFMLVLQDDRTLAFEDVDESIASSALRAKILKAFQADISMMTGGVEGGLAVDGMMTVKSGTTAHFWGFIGRLPDRSFRPMTIPE